MEQYSLIGIDFATSTTVVKVKNYHNEMNPKDYETLTFDHNFVLPSLIFEDDKKNLYFGYDAESRVAAGTPGRLYRNFKMDLLNKTGAEKEKVISLITEYFKYLHKHFVNAKSELQYFPKQKVILSFPVKWSPDIKSLMKNCIVKAGFCNAENVLEESEPTAAIYATLVWHLEELQRAKIILKGKSINVFMLDMGAGTSDAAIFRLKINDDDIPVVDQMITYPTLEQDLLCGGREIDDCLNQHVLQYMNKCLDVDTDMIPVITDRIAVKAWKDKIVSPTLSDSSVVDTAPGYIVKLKTFIKRFGGIKDVPFDVIGRPEFESLTSKHWQNLHCLISGAIEAAKNKIENFSSAEDVDLVILTGGHSQWYGVRKLFLSEPFGNLQPLNFIKIQKDKQRLILESNPQETVALGLVYHDLKLDVKRVMGNNLSIGYEIDQAQSPIAKVAMTDDVLPISKKISYNYDVNTDLWDTKAITVKCFFIYGGEKRKKKLTVIKKLPMPTVFKNISTAVIKTPKAVGKLISGLPKGSATAISAFTDVYVQKLMVNISSNINISTNEHVSIEGSITINDSEGIPFNVNI